MKSLRIFLAAVAALLTALSSIQAQSLTVEGDLNVEGDTTIGDATNRGSLLIYGPSGASATNAVTIQSDGGFVMEAVNDVEAFPVVSAGATAFMWFPGESSLVIGKDNPGLYSNGEVSDYSFTLGEASKAKGDASFALGYGVEALQQGAFAFGYNSIASGSFSFAFGIDVEAHDSFSFAFGDGSVADGYQAISIGSSYVLGSDSISLGENIASGDFIVTLGWANYVYADKAVVIGHRLQNPAYGSVVLGIYNDDSITYSGTQWIGSELLMAIGNGQSTSTRSNAVEIKKNGEALFKGYGASSGEIILKPQDGASYIEIDGMRVVTQGAGGEAYLTQDEGDARYDSRYVPSSATELGIASGTATHSDTLIVGTGNSSSGVGQTVVGRYSDATDHNAFAIGIGQDGSNRATAFSVNSDGDAVIARDAYVNRNLLVAANTQMNGDVSVNGTLHAQDIYIRPSGSLSMGNFTGGGTPASTLDSDVEDYVAEVNALRATPLDNDAIGKINALAQYLKQQGLWNDTCVLLFSSDYNAGTGDAAVSLGGWTSNNVTLVDSPGWSSAGLEFDGVNDYATLDLTGLRSVSSFTVMARIAPDNASASNSPHGAVLSFGEGGTTLTAWACGAQTGNYSNETWSLIFMNGSNKRLGTDQSSYSWAASEDFIETVQCNGSGTKLWKEKSEVSLNLPPYNMSISTHATPSQTGYTTDDIAKIGGTNSFTGQFDGKMKSLFLYKITLTTTQREMLIDLVNLF